MSYGHFFLCYDYRGCHHMVTLGRTLYIHILNVLWTFLSLLRLEGVITWLHQVGHYTYTYSMSYGHFFLCYDYRGCHHMVTLGRTLYIHILNVLWTFLSLLRLEGVITWLHQVGHYTYTYSMSYGHFFLCYD